MIDYLARTERREFHGAGVPVAGRRGPWEESGEKEWGAGVD